jgi:YidC/Oxa1 family membrane protein insertase
LQITKQDFTGSNGKAIGTVSVAAPVLSNSSVRLYVGPKDEQWLKKAEPRLTSVVNYGFFEVITRPLLAALLWIHSYIGNFGWAIIILTLGINFILFPLRLKQQVSMQKMQKLQPQMRTLQDRYKKLKASDSRRAEVQMEMMNLYKENGVNPMGGCLPLLLQMPLLFAFWNMLSVSIELRQAPWILWIKDLSQYDPYFIIPIAMAVSMIISQKMTPTSVDPAQAKMMLIMPVMLTAMFLWLQSGVTLYYLTSNVVGIGQQWFIKKYWSHDTAKPERVAKNKPI